MKFYCSLFLSLLSFLCLAQTDEQQAIFSNAHLLEQGPAKYIKVEGYSIFSYDHQNLSYDKRGIRKARRKYGINKKAEALRDSAIPSPHEYHVIKEEVGDGMSMHHIYYFLPTKGNKLKVIGLSVCPTRDRRVERLFVQTLTGENLPSQINTSLRLDSVQFVNGYLNLGDACRWMSPHNIQCPNFGQMSWSECRTLERAEEILHGFRTITANKRMGEVLESDTLDVIFEGVECKATRIKYKIKMPGFIMGGSNILIIYYVATPLRGKNVACVMSHYSDDVADQGLSPLLSEVMRLK